MAAKSNSYWHDRLVRWGKWCNGGRTLARTSQDAIEAGLTRPPPSDVPPADHSEDAETGEFIAMLKPDEQGMARAAYVDANAPRRLKRPASELSAIFLAVCRTRLNRLLRQRQRGEPLDPARVSSRARHTFTRLQGQRAAATAEPN